MVILGGKGVAVVSDGYFLEANWSFRAEVRLPFIHTAALTEKRKQFSI